MQTYDLCSGNRGEWTVQQAGDKSRFPAAVPGCVHTDLLAAGAIDDPFVGDNELRVQWIGEADWTYSREFGLPADFLAHERVLLRCEMLDTLATVKVNGRLAGRADNMFRTWEFDVKRLLRPGRNEIEVRFDSTIPYMEKRARKAGDRIKGDPRHWVRKEPCNYGWDWGPRLVTCGIQRPIELVAFDAARLSDIHVRQDHSRKGRVALEVSVASEILGKARVSAEISVSRQGECLDEAEIVLGAGKGKAGLLVEKPELWWPAGMGEQPLYLVRKKDRWGETFEFHANGRPFFAKGANWIPADVFASRVTGERYAGLLRDAVRANMNMIRVWGGGVYEDDRFYDLCDEMGICVWQDFMFACESYPTFDRAFMENVRREAEDNVRRLRHHPSVALWCGNNELEMFVVPNRMTWAEYGKLFDRMLPEVVRKLDPEGSYWPSSPHSPRGDRQHDSSEKWGDAHLWAVWHGRRPFEWYRSAPHRFVSEFGFQSFPEPKTVESFAAPRDRNVTSPVMEHHQRSGPGNTVIMQYMLDWFRMPKGFEETLWLSQILQSVGIKYAVEHWRRNMPRTMGALYWQIDDCWPVASWASIDSEGRWKALHYEARRFFAPVLVSGLEDPGKGTVDVHVTSDLARPSAGRLRWEVTDVAGRRLASGSKSVRVAARKSGRVQTLDLSRLLSKHGARDLLVWLELSCGKEVVSANLVAFARPKHMDLADPGITTKVKAARDGAFPVALKAKRPALWAWIELEATDARYSDNFVHLAPGRPVEIEVCPAKKMSPAQLAKKLVVRSLADTY
jgi:beta-mannosidase